MVVNNGFQKVDITTGDINFEWWALDHVSLTESMISLPSMPNSVDTAWDFFHMNSVDKSANGDYLVSARHTNCIYKISGLDGSIIWRLGGWMSSFIMDGFNFSSQHDARFQQENSSITIISFLNNGADEYNATAAYSSAFLVALYTSISPMTARVIKQWKRPDHELSRLRGNMQILPNTNVVVGWSENGYLSEFTADGRCVLEARFVSSRFVTYRDNLDTITKPGWNVRRFA